MSIDRFTKKFSLSKIAVVFVMIIAVFIVVLKFDGPAGEKKAGSENAVTPLVAKSYSRVSIFNTQPVRVSLAVPDYWEGNYRIKENGRIANFYYIGQGQELKILALYLDSGEQDGLDKNKVKLDEKKGYTISYELFAIDEGEDRVLSQMASDRPGITASAAAN